MRNTIPQKIGADGLQVMGESHVRHNSEQVQRYLYLCERYRSTAIMDQDELDAFQRLPLVSSFRQEQSMAVYWLISKHFKQCVFRACAQFNSSSFSTQNSAGITCRLPSALYRTPPAKCLQLKVRGGLCVLSDPFTCHCDLHPILSCC